MATPTYVRARTRILIASADAGFRQRVKKDPQYAGADSEEAVGGAHALSKLLQFPCDSVVLDRNLPDLDATDVADEIRKQFPRVDVELVDAELARVTGQADEACEREECEQDAGVDKGVATIHEARVESTAAGGLRDRSGDATRVSAVSANPLPGMIGSSSAMRQVYEQVRMVAHRDTTVLITGETGTGKELVAGAIHQLSRRSRQPFVVVNCAAIPEALLESELFGHARGAFTGAAQSRLGRIHVAQGGTLFLDEIGELPLSMQAKLLRFLQNGEVQRLGSPDVYRVDVRVVCATNVELPELVKSRQFRADLYYRLAIFPIAVPPLREHAEDICALSSHFLEKLSDDVGLPRKRILPGALTHLQRGKWAGNVRELQHAIERAFIVSGDESELCVEHFQAFSAGSGLREI